jgi:hypothetical protein
MRTRPVVIKKNVVFCAIDMGESSEMLSATAPFESRFVKYQTKFGVLKWFTTNEPGGKFHIFRANITDRGTLQKVRILQ